MSRSVEQVQRVAAVVDEVDPGSARPHGQAEERPAPRRRARSVQRLYGHLLTSGGGLDQVAVAGVDAQDVLVQCDCQTQRAVEGAATGNRLAGRGVVPSQRVANGDDRSSVY